jgi:hypothetical protein
VNGNGTRSPDAILESIQRTRTDMDSTLHAIEEKLTPGQMMDRGLDYLRNSGGREFLSNLGASVRTNPVPAVLVGIGIAWLMMTKQRNAGTTFGRDYDTESFGEDMRDRAADMRDRASDVVDSAKDTVVDAVISARDSMTGKTARARDGMADTAARARDGIADTAARARDGIADTAARARAAWDRTSDTTRAQMDRVRGGYRQIMEEQPLALGALGLGLGALLAAAAPRTRVEDETLGKVADRLKDQVAEAGHEQMERARTAATEVSDAVQSKTDSPSSPHEPGTRPLDE